MIDLQKFVKSYIFITKLCTTTLFHLGAGIFLLYKIFNNQH